MFYKIFFINNQQYPWALYTTLQFLGPSAEFHTGIVCIYCLSIGVRSKNYIIQATKVFGLPLLKFLFLDWKNPNKDR